MLVTIIGLNKLNGCPCVNYTLNGYMFLDWVKEGPIVSISKGNKELSKD